MLKSKQNSILNWHYATLSNSVIARYRRNLPLTLTKAISSPLGKHCLLCLLFQNFKIALTRALLGGVWGLCVKATYAKRVPRLKYEFAW